MKKLFIGIDISKDKFDFCILSDEHKILLKGHEVNSKKGIANFCKYVDQYPDLESWICMEHTGHYGYLLCHELSEKSLTYSMLSPLDLKRSMGLIRGKSDPVDAFRIASYALTHQHNLKPYTLPEEALRKLKVTTNARESLKRESVKFQNRIKALKIVAQTTDITAVLDVLEKQLDFVQAGIKQLEKQMKEIIQSSEILKNTYQKITGISGVALITAASIIVETENFITITNPRKFACHSGIAPFPYSSGSSVHGRNKTSHLCKRIIKGILFKASASAIQHDSELKEYYQRKLKEGKHKLSALNAVANKLVLRIFAVQKRDSPYLANVA